VPVRFGVLGPLEARGEAGQTVRLGGAKQRSVLALLLLRPGSVVSMDTIIDAIWGASASAGAASTVQVYISQLRRLLEDDPRRPQLLATQSPGYILRVGAAQLDSLRFKELASRGRACLAAGRFAEAERNLDEALGLWRGTVLTDLPDLASAAPVQPEVARLDDQRWAALEDRSEAVLALGRHADLVADLEALWAKQPLREQLVSHLMLALYRCGRQADALRVYDNLRARLSDELGVDPSLAVRELHQRLLRQDSVLDVPSGMALRPVPPPVPPTPLVGREAELETVSRLLARDEVRLVTITGTGGSGKTRLALELTHRLWRKRPSSVVFVPLADLSDAGLISATIAAHAGLDFAAETDPAAALISALADCDVTIVIDNAEHLLAGVADHTRRLLERTHSPKLLVTSRTALRMRSEFGFALEPLPLPSRDQASETLVENPAVALFLGRVAAVSPTSLEQPGATETAAMICRALDGLPLALELAAARSRALSLDELAMRVGDAVGILRGGPRDLPERQRTLHATLRWSCELLPAGHRRDFAVLSVFTGGFTLTAAERIAGDGALDGVDALLGHSLLRHVPEDRDGRLEMLETVRQYARTLLVESGDAVEILLRHVDWVRDLVASAVAELASGQPGDATAVLDAETGNLRAALSWMSEHDVAGAASMVADLRPYWLARGRLTEARQLLGRLLGAPDIPKMVRARAAAVAGSLAYSQEDSAEARGLLTEALSTFTAAGESAEAVRCLCWLGGVTIQEHEGPHDLQERVSQAAGLAVEAFQCAHEADNDALLSYALDFAGFVESFRDKAAAVGFWERAITIERQLGNPTRLAQMLADMAQSNLALGRDGIAEMQAREARELAARAHHSVARRDAALKLGLVLLKREQPAIAVELVSEAQELCIDVGQSEERRDCLAALAVAAAQQGDRAAAARRWGEVCALNEDVSEMPESLQRLVSIWVMPLVDQDASASG
jgi:predicted ATPase/DNA-binding SARP family transcriptional activator